MSKKDREKGKRGERELARILRDHGFEAKRTGWQQSSGGQEAADVSGIDGYHIECKRAEKLNVHEAMKQSIQDAKDGEIPVVIFRRNGEPWLVLERLEDWITKIERS